MTTVQLNETSSAAAQNVSDSPSIAALLMRELFGQVGQGGWMATFQSLIGNKNPDSMDDATIETIADELNTVIGQLKALYNGTSGNPLDAQYKGDPSIKAMLDMFNKPVTGKAGGLSIAQAIAAWEQGGDDTDMKDIIAALNTNGQGTGWSTFCKDLANVLNS